MHKYVLFRGDTKFHIFFVLRHYFIIEIKYYSEFSLITLPVLN